MKRGEFLVMLKLIKRGKAYSSRASVNGQTTYESFGGLVKKKRTFQRSPLICIQNSRRLNGALGCCRGQGILKETFVQFSF